MLNGVGPCSQVLIEDIAVEPDAALPGDGGGVGIDADFLELAHVAPQLERADLEQVAEEHAALEAVLEAQPELVVFLGLACGDSMHFVPLLFHLAPPRHFLLLRVIPNSARRRSGTRSRGSRRSCAPSSGRSSRSSTERGSALPGRAPPARSAGSAGWG